MSKFKKSNYKYVWWIIFSFVFLFWIIYGTIVFTTFSNKITNNTQKIIQNNIEESLKERQILVRVKNKYLINSIEQEEIIYLNSYFLDENTILLHLKAFDILNNDIVEKDISFTSYDLSINKNVNDPNIWTSIYYSNQFEWKSTSKLDNLEILDKQYIKFKIKDKHEFNYKNFELNCFYRENYEAYPYFYSAFFIKDNIINFYFDFIYIKNKLDDFILNCSYKLTKNGLTLQTSIYKKIFTINSSFNTRNIGTINSLIIDPIGYLFAIQSDFSNNDGPLFYGLGEKYD